jgi:multicomponent Na+:H+ antiporter subunit A
VIAAAVGTIIATRRLGAVLFLGAVGYGVAVLFVIQGAPDLALTQLLMETLALALFILVLTSPPFAVRGRGHPDPAGHQDRGLGCGVGLAAGASRCGPVSGPVAPSLAPEYLRPVRARRWGAQRDNVILTDFRALDTLGEITVLAVVAMGAMALVRARLTESPQQEEGEPVIEEEGSSS